MTPRRLWTIAATVGVAIAAAVMWTRQRQHGPLPSAVPAPAPAYAGSRTCATCHPSEASAWRSSQHAAAMAEATPDTVLGRFDGAAFRHSGVTSTFFRRDGRFFVRTDGPDGALADFPIDYTFGVFPLQQYLIRLPGGRWQALGIAWDARPAAAGGQRWFHLYPRETLKAGDPLHWTGLQQNWNFMCADCHSTNVRKGYDASRREYRTTWSEISVGCEACHGPGSMHVDSAKTVAAGARPAALPARFDPRPFPIATRSGAIDGEIEVCARCHARRSQLTDLAKAGDPLENGFRPVLLEPGLFYSDGQQREEVYTYASFLQSRMYTKGVTCADCHDPHSGRTRFEGNALCTRCHVAATYDAPAHHFHRAATTGSLCVSCHMPATTYMQIDPRRDHSFKVPRPGQPDAPNACTMACHSTRSAAWAAAEIARHRPTPVVSGFSRTVPGLAPAGQGTTNRTTDGRTTGASAAPIDTPIVRATELARADPASPGFVARVAAALGDSNPMVRRAALAALSRADAAIRLQLAPPLLKDPIRTVRTEAVLCLLDLADRSLSGQARAGFDAAFDEFLAEHRFNADRPESQTALGTAWLTRGRADLAIPALEEAIRLDPTFVPAYVNLADAQQTAGNESAVERVLRDGLRAAPGTAALHHALGLALVRQKRMPEAMTALAEAARREPETVRFTYTYIVALYDTGKRADALALLRAARRRHPDAPEFRELEQAYGDVK